MTQQTKGEYIVGITFNPSQSGMVDQIKLQAAALIDLIHTIHAKDVDVTKENAGEFIGEVARLKSLAITHIETAAMFAVKAQTKGMRE
jgi:hypothetical protein